MTLNIALRTDLETAGAATAEGLDAAERLLKAFPELLDAYEERGRRITALARRVAELDHIAQPYRRAEYEHVIALRRRAAAGASHRGEQAATSPIVCG